ncbi:MAG: tRNA-intron lyase [Candidatus Thermoplasmatota archaeon]|nr:tRNA-intron lyase [Candidatus Thermoplasmatota archaeon]
MELTGELVDNKILITKSKQVGRLFNKSHFGKPITGNRLYLNLLEGVFLLGEGKLRIFCERKEIFFKELFEKASSNIPHFEQKYIVFRDLRKRGLFAHLNLESRDYEIIITSNQPENKLSHIYTFSERDRIKIIQLSDYIKTGLKQKINIWIAIVDEEGDITYYDISEINICGQNKKFKFTETKGILLENRVLIFDKKSSEELFKKEFIGKPFEGGLQISFVEALYLMDSKILNIYKVNESKSIYYSKFLKIAKKTQPDIDLRIFVYKDLKKLGLIVKTGFKFGSHFRVYTRNPDEIHAEYLVQVVEKEYEEVWSEISRAVRLAHSVNKEFIFAKINDDKINYIKFGRLRP